MILSPQLSCALANILPFCGIGIMAFMGWL